MKALTIHYPWAWAIITGIKRVENRNWRTNYRGPLLIHAGFSKESDDSAVEWLSSLGVVLPPTIEFVRGHIIGKVELVDILPLEEYLIKHGTDPMNRNLAIGKFCWVLENPKKCEPIRCPGKQQLWSPEQAIKKLGGDPKSVLDDSNFKEPKV